MTTERILRVFKRLSSSSCDVVSQKDTISNIHQQVLKLNKPLVDKLQQSSCCKLPSSLIVPEESDKLDLFSEDQLREYLNSLDRKCSQSDDQLNKLRSQLNDSKAVISNLTNEVSKLKRDYATAESERQEYSATALRCIRDEDACKKNNALLSSQIDNLNKEIAKCREQLASGSSDASQLIQRVSTLENDLRECQSKRSSLQNESDTLKRTLENYREVGRNLNDAENKLAKCNTERDNLLLNKRANESEIAKLTNQVNGLNEQISNLNAQIKELNDKECEESPELVPLRRQLNQVQKQRDDLQTRVTTLQGDKSKLSENLRKQKENNQNLLRNREELNKQITTLTTEKDKLSRDVTSQGTLLETLTNQKNQLQLDKDNLQAQLREAESKECPESPELPQLREQIQQLTTNLNAANTNLEKYREAEKKLESDKTQLTNISNLYKDEADKLRKEVETLKVDKKKLDDRIKELESYECDEDPLVETYRTEYKKVYDCLLDSLLILDQTQDSMRYVLLDFDRLNYFLTNNNKDKADEIREQLLLGLVGGFYNHAQKTLSPEDPPPSKKRLRPKLSYENCYTTAGIFAAARNCRDITLTPDLLDSLMFWYWNKKGIKTKKMWTNSDVSNPQQTDPSGSHNVDDLVTFDQLTTISTNIWERVEHNKYPAYPYRATQARRALAYDNQASKSAVEGYLNCTGGYTGAKDKNSLMKEYRKRRFGKTKIWSVKSPEEVESV